MMHQNARVILARSRPCKVEICVNILHCKKINDLLFYKKKTKYEAIASTHLFFPIATETSGVFGPDAYEILYDLARQIKATRLTRRHTFSNKYLLWCREAMQHLFVWVYWFRLTCSVVIYVLNCVCLELNFRPRY